MELFKLFGTIMVDNTKANESIHKTDEKAEGLGNKFLSGIGTAAKWGMAIGAAAIAGATALTGMAMKSAETADRIDKLSARTGLSKQAFQEWDYVLGQNGINIEVMKNGVKTLTAQMDAATKGTGAAAENFSKLGIAVTDSNGVLRNQEDVMKETLVALADLPNGTEKAKMATELFGKAGLELMPMLNNGSASIEELTQRAHDLGLVMSDEAVDAGVKLGDTMDDVKQSFGMIATKIGVEVMPIVQQGLDWVLTQMPTIQSVLNVVFMVINEFVTSVVGFITNYLIPAFDLFFGSAIEGCGGFQGAMQTMADFITPLLNDLKGLFQAVLGVIVEYFKLHKEEILSITKSLFDAVKTIVETVMGTIRGIIQVITGLLKGDWEQVWNGLKLISESILNGIVRLVSDLLNIMINIIIMKKDTFLNAGKGIFTAIWDGMKEIWEKLSSWISDKVTWIADKLSFWKKSKSEMDDGGGSGGGGYDGSHANGLNYVPFDGYIAELHKGERVLTAEENKQYSNKNKPNITINQHIYAKVENERAMQREAERRFVEQIENLGYIG